MSTLRNCLEESHKDLYQWFLLHQECLLLQNDDYARQAFQVFADYLQAHLAFENTFLLNVEATQGLSLHWPSTIYKKEHEKLEKMLAQIDGYLREYHVLSGREKRLALLALLDEEQTFRHVMEHHEQREEKDLFLHFPDDIAAYKKWLEVNVGLDDKHAVFKEELKVFLAGS